MTEVEDLFHLFGNRNRLEILTALAEEHSPMSFSGLKDRLKFNPNTLVFHLDSLEDAGFIERSRAPVEQRRHSLYSATDRARELLKKLNIDSESLHGMKAHPKDISVGEGNLTRSSEKQKISIVRG